MGNARMGVGGEGVAAATQGAGRTKRRDVREAIRGEKARVPSSVMSADWRRERVETASPRVEMVGCWEGRKAAAQRGQGEGGGIGDGGRGRGGGARGIGQVTERRVGGKSSWKTGLPHKGMREHQGPGGVSERDEVKDTGPKACKPASMRVMGPSGKGGRLGG